MRLLPKTHYRLILYLLLIIFCCCSTLLRAQPTQDTQQIFSPQIAYEFHRIAQELYTSENIDSTKVDCAMVLLDAAANLDGKADYISTDILNVGLNTTDENHLRIFYRMLEKYASEPGLDLELAGRAVRHLMVQMDSRQAREDMLSKLLKATSSANPMFASELATQLALLAVEKTDFNAATYYLTYAYTADPYNRLAFTKLDEITQQSQKQIELSVYAKHMRLAMMAAPLDTETVFAFAQFSERLGMYSLAASTYEYSARLFEYNFGGIDLPASIYLPWAIAAYNTERGHGKCLEIARRVRRTGQFDIVLEAIAASAARKMGDLKKNMEILQAGSKAEKLLINDSASSDITAEKLAWFYCFPSPHSEKALAWANKALSQNPDSPSTKAVFAYALVMNNQSDIAQEYIVDLYSNNQIASIAMGMIQLARNDKSQALETLKASVAMDPGSLEAEHAKNLLAENGSEYISKVSAELIFQALENEFSKRVFPEFKKPSEMISAKLNLSGSEFTYGGEFDAKLVITNASSQPLVVFDYGLFAGNIRVDAEIRGDITTTITNLISKRIRPSRAIEPGRYVSVPLELITGPLRQLLFTYPQASLEIEFIVYLDPVADTNAGVKNALWDIQPVKTVVKRTGLALSRKYLMQRLATLAGGREGQKIQATKLFVGLLAESNALEKTGPLYRYMQVDRLILADAVKRALVDENWKVKVQTISDMLMLGSIDYNLTQALAERINDDYWPVRMIALYNIGNTRQADFQEVLDWTARNDSQLLVRNMAVALGGLPVEIPDDVPASGQ
jgi:tetratricopeptide (TPR) repeat protein